MEEVKSESLGSDRLRAVLLSSFSAVAIVLAAVGIYGVLSYSVAQRKRELGIRAALGASRWEQLKLVMNEGMILAGSGVLIGAGGTLAIVRVLRSLLFGVSPYDPLNLIVVGAILVTVAAIAAWIPAVRATRVQPQTALRSE